MAYATSNPPALVSQRVGASGGAIWLYKDGDALATVIADDYVSNGDALGMEVGDVVFLVDETNGTTHVLQVAAVTSGGAATLSVAAQGGAVETLTAATKSPDAADNNTLFLLSRAAGITVTLPTPVVGLKYRFLIITAVTSNDYGIDTDGAATFFTGAIQQIIDASGTSEGQVADGTAHVSMNQNGSTTGGLAGSYWELECISATLWRVSGTLVGSGTLSTPFA